ncbi:MAG: S9 family peptidase [Acidobacteria bacterium]|nr:MAG: S9 family peptidase [Acidobacteriota bacterium]
MRSMLVLTLTIVSALSSFAQTKRAMTIDDLITAIRVSEPRISPDGKQVMFTRTTTALDSGRRNADIWSVPADGSAPSKELIGGDKTENSPRFTPDGRHIAFISNRDGAAQVYLADAGGGGVKQVTKVSGGVQPPLVMSPDGKRVAFVSDVYPQCKDEECNRRTREALEKDPVKVRLLTGLPFRHWDEWRTNIRHHVFVADLDTGEARDVTPGDYDSPPHFYEDGGIVFAPDSRTIAFVSNRDGRDREMMSTNRDVWLVPVMGGEPKKITANPAADNQPVFSPDGTLLAVSAQRRPGFESDRWYIDLYNLATGSKRTLFESPDISVEELTFSSNGRSIFFTASEKGTLNLYVIPVSGGVPKLVTKGGSISQLQAGPDFLLFSKSTLTAPPELFRVSLDGSSTKQLTNENSPWLSRTAMPQIESLTVTGAAGTAIQYWLLKPPNFDPSRKYPAVFLIHGGPQGDWGDSWSSRWNPALWAAQGWIVAAPNPRGSTGFGQRFVDEISQDWCGKVMVDLNAVFDAVAKFSFVDPQRMGIAGASYGGYAVDWLLGHTDRFKAAVSHDGVFNLETMSYESEELWFTDWESGGPPWSTAARKHFARCSPHLSADKIKTPTLVITNEQDFRVPVDQGLQLFTALRRNGVPSETLVFSDEGHWVLGALDSKRWHETVFGWMKKYIGQ